MLIYMWRRSNRFFREYIIKNLVGFLMCFFVFLTTNVYADEIIATLHPQSSCPIGTPVLVSFGMPFPKDFIEDSNRIRVKDISGSELFAHIRVLLPWRDLMSGSNLSSIRSVLVQANITFSSLSPVNIIIETGSSRTKNIGTEVPVKDNWVLVNDSKYPVAYGVYEPLVYVTLPPDWMGNCGIKSYTVPYGTYEDFQWYDRTLANNNPAINDGQNFFKTMINDDVRVTEANDIDYLEVGEYEPYLFDRAMTMYTIYIRSGNIEVLREAHRSAFFYGTHITANGYFDLNTTNDLKYSYGESILTDLILTGDEEFSIKFGNIVSAADTFNPVFNPEADHGLWTERHLAFAWLAYIVAFEATGNSVYATKACFYADTIFTHQNNPPANIAHGQAPDDGGLMHSFLMHEGYWDGPEPFWIFSPWMSVLLVDAMQRYYYHSGDSRVIASAKRFGDAICDVALANFVMEGKTRRIPWYLVSSVETYTDSGEWADMEHSLEVAKITAFAYNCSVLEGTPVQKYLDETLLLLDTAEWVLNSWIRPGGPAAGLSIYRLSPPRKGNWWFRTTSDIDYLIKEAKPLTHISPKGSDSGLASVKVYPNPFIPSKGSTIIKFINLTENNEIRIYTVKGALVKRITKQETGTNLAADWDVKNDQGEEVVSGIYMYIITDDKGNKKEGKISIIR